MKRKFFRASWMLALAGMVAFTFVGTSCGDDDDDPAPAPTPSNNNGNNSGENGNGNGNGNGKENEGDGIADHVVVVKSQDKVSQSWDTQFWFGFKTEFKAGDSWKVSFDYKADASTDVKVASQIHNGAGNWVNNYDAIASVKFSTEWKHFEAEGTFDENLFAKEDAADAKYSKMVANCIVFNLNDHSAANQYYFDNISFVLNEEEVIENGDFEGDDFSCFWIKEAPAGETDTKKIDDNPPVEVTKANIVAKPASTEEAPRDPNTPLNQGWDFTKVAAFPYYVMGYTPTYDAENGLMSEAPIDEETGEAAWYQYFVADKIPTEVGKKYTIEVEMKADAEGTLTANMGWGWEEGQKVSTQVSFTTEWTTKKFDFADPVQAESCNVVFQPGTFASKIYIRSVKVFAQAE